VVSSHGLRPLLEHRFESNKLAVVRPLAYVPNSSSHLPLDAQFAISGTLGKQIPSYHALEATGGYRLDNRKQALSASFLPIGVAIQTGSARWGLALNAYGYGSDLRAVPIVAPQAESNRVEYRRGPLTEWYVNGPLGLQQGFTLASRPGTESGKPLTLVLTLSGELKAEVDQGGSGLTLRREGGAVALKYRGLSAYDAAGRQLHAWLENAPVSLPNKQDAAETILLVRVDDSGAKYTLVIDPFIQQAKLTASDGAADDLFGSSVAISGDTVVVGAPNDDSSRGSAYVFVKPGTGGWINSNETAKLTASDGQSADLFGSVRGVAISGDTVVVGALNDASGTSVNQGSAYVFVKPASGGWANATETAKLTASDGMGNDQFGQSVSISGDTVVVGAAADDSNGQGSAYVFGQPSAVVTVNATDSNAAEAGPDPGVFTVTRTGDTTNALTVNFTVGGTAAAGSDYGAIGTSVVIPAGASSETITITPIADGLNEGSETVILTLASGTGYTVGDPSTATVNIANYTGGLLRGQLKQVNFGNVRIGSTANKSLVIQNGSTTASLVVKVNNPTPNPPFSLVSGGGTVVIAPGGSHTVGYVLPRRLRGKLRDLCSSTAPIQPNRRQL
jgi:hypothetical protein